METAKTNTILGKTDTFIAIAAVKVNAKNLAGAITMLEQGEIRSDEFKTFIDYHVSKIQDATDTIDSALAITL